MFFPLIQVNNKICDKAVLDRYCDIVGDLPFKKIRKADIIASQMKRAETPGVADKFVKYIKVLFNWAIEEELTTLNPANGITKINKSDGFFIAGANPKYQSFAILIIMALQHG